MFHIMGMVYGVLFFLVALWVYCDAETRGMRSLLWALLTFLGQPFWGLILYLIFRKPKELYY